MGRVCRTRLTVTGKDHIHAEPNELHIVQPLLPPTAARSPYLLDPWGVPVLRHCPNWPHHHQAVTMPTAKCLVGPHNQTSEGCNHPLVMWEAGSPQFVVSPLLANPGAFSFGAQPEASIFREPTPKKPPEDCTMTKAQ